MGDIFIRRTTGILLAIICVLSILCVGLIFYAFPSKEIIPDENSLPLESPSRNEKLQKTNTAPKIHPWEKQYRIPKDTIPVHYDLYLHPDLDAGSYTGNVKILVSVTSPMKFLVAHTNGLNITMTQLMDLSMDKYVSINEAFEYKPNQFWVVKPKSELKPGNYSLELKFDGSLMGKIVGFYRSVYKTKLGEERSIATSKFQPTYARQAFPCFDEPSFKSSFKITLVRPSENYIALSNMPLESERRDTPRVGLTEAVFEKSVPMVTYLACFIVCDFESVSTLTQDKKDFKVYATKDQISRAEYAKNIGVHILNYFERYFEVEYPLPKQDMIAIPDFVSGAMEHWGLITYREVNLLYDDQSSSSRNKQRVASVISHELAHMWFGNLVTLKWWDDLWLNEGFASYIEYKGVASYEKEWDMEGQFLHSDLHYVMDLDAQLTSHPIVQTVNHPDEITEIFDAISYSKGASVLRMLEDFMGAEDFRIGVRNFLRKYKYGNAVTQDLWTELSNISSKKLNIANIMDTWTRQMGFPVINVEMSQNNKNKLIVTQERFLADPDAKSMDDSPYHYKWDVPISYFTDKSNTEMVWLRRDMKSVEITRPDNSQWIKLNKGQYGYYIVNYELPLWNQLIQQLNTNHEVFDAVDRAHILNDAFMLASSGKLDFQVVLDLSNYLIKETHYIPWKAAIGQLSNYGHLLRKTKAYPKLRKYITHLVKDHVKRLGWEDTGNHLERRNRINMLSLSCGYGDQDCLEEAYRRFKLWIDDPSYIIPPNFRDLIYRYGIQSAGYDEWLILLDRYLNELNAQEKSKLLYGLTNIKKDWIIYRLLDLAKNETIIRSQDYFTVLRVTAGNPTATHIVWSYIKENWEYFVDRFTLNDRYVGRAVKSVISLFASKTELKDVETFFEEYPEAGAGKRARKQAIETLKINMKWISRFENTIYNWLQEKSL